MKRQKKRKQWEYCEVMIGSLREMGANGWELIFYKEKDHPPEYGEPAWTSRSYIFKREKID